MWYRMITFMVGKNSIVASTFQRSCTLAIHYPHFPNNNCSTMSSPQPSHPATPDHSPTTTTPTVSNSTPSPDHTARLSEANAQIANLQYQLAARDDWIKHLLCTGKRARKSNKKMEKEVCDALRREFGLLSQVIGLKEKVKEKVKELRGEVRKGEEVGERVEGEGERSEGGGYGSEEGGEDGRGVRWVGRDDDGGRGGRAAVSLGNVMLELRVDFIVFHTILSSRWTIRDQ
jgi:hypothetical protein